MPGRHPWCTTSWRTRSTPAQPMPTATALSRRGSRVARMDPAPARRRAASSSRASSGSPSPCRRSSTRRPGTERRRNSRVTPRCLRNNTKHNYLLRCLMTCATCGLAMFGRTYAARGKQPERRYYQCHGKDCILSARPAACPSRNVKAEEIEAAVWDHVAGLLASPERLATVLVSSVRMLSTNRDLVRRFVTAHRELTDWIKQNPAEAQRMVRDELRAVVRADVSPELIARAWRRMTVTADLSPSEFQEWLANAQRAGFLRGAPDLARLVETVQ